MLPDDHIVSLRSIHLLHQLVVVWHLTMLDEFIDKDAKGLCLPSNLLDESHDNKDMIGHPSGNYHYHAINATVNYKNPTL